MTKAIYWVLLLQILHFGLLVSFVSHDSEAISNSKYNTVQSDRGRATPVWLLFIPYNVQNPFSALAIDFNTRSLHQSILAGLGVGKHTNSSPESQSNSTLLRIFQWPFLAVSKASRFIWSVCRVIWPALAMPHSLLWLPVLCTSYGWVLHKLLTLLTLCLMNLWDPMSPCLILDVRRYRIWRHQERTMTHQHCTINTLGVTSACKVDWLRSQPLSLRSHRSQGWGRQWGWVPLLGCLLYGKLFQICLASVFLSAQ